MSNPLFTGACTALVTPFANGQINYDLLGRLITRQIQADIPALVLAGTTGEAPTLSDNEKIELFEFGVKYAEGHCKIIAGTGSNNTSHAVDLSIAAQEAGADALLIVSPYYNKANADGLLKHYASIADAVSIPIVLYNVPSRTCVDIPVQVYKELSYITNIVGVKEASTDITKTTKIINTCSPDFTVWSGNDDMTTAMMALGAKGVISVTSNIFPEKVNIMCKNVLSGNIQNAVNIQRDLQTINDALFMDVNPIPVKAALKILGYDCGECRLPLGSLTTEKQKRLSVCLA